MTNRAYWCSNGIDHEPVISFTTHLGAAWRLNAMDLSVLAWLESAMRAVGGRLFLVTERDAVPRAVVARAWR